MSFKNLDAFISLFSNDGRTGNSQANLNFFNLRNTASSALSAVQGYGHGRTAPSPNWNITDHSAEPSSTPSHTFFSGLNLNSVDEEDEFLYGDSNSIPEEQTSVQRDTIKRNIGRFDTRWSDEEDLFDEARGATLNKLNSRLKKSLSDCDSQNKIKENINFPPIKREEILIKDTPPVAEVYEQRYVSQKLEPHHSVSSPVVENNEIPESSSVKDKLKKIQLKKSHISAELLKKRNLGIFPGTYETSRSFSPSRCYSTHISSLPINKYKSSERDHTKYESSYSSRRSPSFDSEKRPSRYTESRRRYSSSPKRYSHSPHYRHRRMRVENNEIPESSSVKDKLKKIQLKKSHISAELLKKRNLGIFPGTYETSRSFSPSRCYSTRISSLPSNKYKSSERDHTKYESSYSSRRSPSFDSEKRPSRYTESRRRYSSSPHYRHRRPHEKSTGYNKYKDRSRRSRSRSPRYYSSKSKSSDKKRISSYSKKKGKSGYSSGDSFCSISLGSSSSSSDKSSKKPVKTLPTDQVSKIRLEQCLDETDIKEKVSCLDQGDHLCAECCNNIKETFRQHSDNIQTAEHNEVNESNDDALDINSLPNEVLVKVFGYLKQNQLGQIARVCKKWNGLTKVPGLWKRVNVKIFTSDRSQAATVKTFINELPSCVTSIRLDINKYKNQCITLHFKNICKKVQERCPHLEELMLTNSKILDSLPSVIALCAQFFENLKNLVFHRCIFSGNCGSEFYDLSKIDILDLSYCRFNYVYGPQFSRMPDLKVLNLYGTNASDLWLTADPSYFNQLHVLNVAHTSMDPILYKEIFNNGLNLKELYLCSIDLQDIFSSFNLEFPQLQRICFGDSFMSCDNLISLIQSCPSLQNVYVNKHVAKSFAAHPFVVANTCKAGIVKAIDWHHIHKVTFT